MARLELATGQVEEVFRPQRPAYLKSFAISPDMTQIVYGFRDPSHSDAYAIVSLAGGEPKIIFECKGDEWARLVTFTGDGKGVLLPKVVKRTPTKNARFTQEDELWHVPLNGAEPRLLHKTIGWTPTVAARPNSREIAWHTPQMIPPEFWMLQNVTAPLSRSGR